MKRRDFLKAAPAALAVTALPVSAMVAQDPLAAILHHASELRRLLTETLPEGGNISSFMLCEPDGRFMTTGPNGLVFRSNRGGWAVES